tara:strand:+ start:15080 stop:16222 length:1143 start_codon:yes stop_codon:yes gene_type:complete
MALVDDKPHPLFEVMQSRNNYRTVSSPSRLMGEQPSIDLTSKEKRMYGKVDTNNDAISILPDIRRKQFFNSSVFGLGFVVDACNDFMAEYNQRISNFPEDAIPGLDSLLVVKDTIPYNDVVTARRKEIIDYIVSYYAKTYNNKIMNFEDFVSIFFRWAEEGAHEDPITNSGIVRCHSVPNAISGLTVVFGNYSENNDRLRGSIVAHPNYAIYSNMAARYGFYITKNSPWRLVANIESSRMQSYINNYVIEPYQSFSDFFEDFYYKSHRVDMRDFQLVMLASYNAFVHYNPIAKQHKICPDGTCMTTNKVRVKMRSEQLNKDYDLKWWLTKLYDLRCFESGMKKKSSSRKFQIHKEIENSYDEGDLDQALDFINDLIKASK